MTDKELSYFLRNTNLDDCEYCHDGIFYIRRIVKLRVYNPQLRREQLHPSLEEFLIITENGIKQAIIHNCNNSDLHWYVYQNWRDRHVLSNALRTGIIKETWPDITSVTCCYNWDDNKVQKYQMTKHLASLADLEVHDGNTCWISV